MVEPIRATHLSRIGTNGFAVIVSSYKSYAHKYAKRSKLS